MASLPLPLEPPVGSLFYLLAAVAQVLLGSMIVVRGWRREWAWILAGLFFANAGYAFSFALQTWSASAEGDCLASHVGAYFDEASFILLAYLALAFPSRPRALQRLPWLLPAVLGTLLVVAFALNALHVEAVHNARRSPINVPRLLLGFAVPAAVWSLLLARWTWLWRRPMPPLRRRQFQLVFAAFGIRAANQVVVTLPVSSGFSPPHLAWAAQAFNTLALATLLACVVALALTQGRQAGAPRSQTFFVLGFLAAGLMVASFSGTEGFNPYIANTLGHFDLYLVRPALVWFAIARHGALGEGWPGRTASLALWWLLALAAFTDTVALRIAQRIPTASLAATTLLVGAVLATAFLVAARPWLLTAGSPGAAGSGLDPAAQAYRAALEDAYRNGNPTARELEALERRRDWLGIAPEQHAALLDAMARAARQGRAPAQWSVGTIAAGRYRVERLLGEGAMGEAYEAHDVLAGHPVVLKRTRKLDPGHRRLLLREAEALSRIHDPHVVRLLGTEFAGEEPVLVLELVPGGSLATRIAEGGPVPVAQALPIALDVLAALSALHEAGLSHNDVKPANILLHGPRGAKLADFGVVRPASPQLGDPTAQPLPAGSLRYMAPEVVQGAHADGRADLYSVAVVLHEMLAGRHPVPEGADFQVRKAIVEGKPPPLPPDVPAALRKAVARALEKDPARRHPTAAAFAHALREAIPGTPA
ncbi:MAG: serine/threonine protein kinase [Halobacteriales archaeon]|nr:serine/threonine protein kinase [Halobacteriales archaeon]